MTTRSGVTLVETLVAIFVMAIGLLSLLTLFPLGALNMAQAIKDDRAANSAQAATALAKFIPQMTGPTYSGSNGLRSDPNIWGTGAINGYTHGPGSGGLPDLTTMGGYNGPSYPVYVDPLGVFLGFSRIGDLVGSAPNQFTALLPRRTPSLIGTSATQLPDIRKWFYLPDDIYFGDSGTPLSSGALSIPRETRYSWAYLLKVPQLNIPATPTPPYPASAPITEAQADLTVIVYDRRPQMVNLTGTKPAGEEIFGNPYGGGVVFDPTTNLVTIQWSAGALPPNVRKGTWLFDTTVNPSQQQMNGFFYRVLSVNQPSQVIANQGINDPNTMDLEVQGTIKATGYACVVMENVIEVFERGVN